MKRATTVLLAVTLAFLAACGNSSPGGDIFGINTPAAGGLQGGAVFGTPSLALKTCPGSQILKYSGSSWDCADDAEGVYTAGDGLDLTGTVFSLLTGCSDGEIPKRVSGAWTCAADEASSPSTQTVTATGTVDVTYDGSSTVLLFTGSGNQTLRTLSASVDGQCVHVVKQSGWSLSITDKYASATAGTKVDVYATGSLDFTSGFASRPTGVTLCYVSAADSGNGAWVQSSTVYELGTGLTESSGTMSVDIAGASCSAGQHVSAISSDGTGTCSADAGDITSVVAGAGLTGGATSGAATLDVNPGAGLIVNGADQVRLLGSCADGQVLKSGSTGSTWSCADDIDHALVTSGVVPMGDGSTQVASGITSDGANVTHAGDTDLTAGTTTVGAFGGMTQVSTLTGTQNDFALDADATTLRFSGATPPTLFGIAGGFHGRRLKIENDTTSTMQIGIEGSGSTTSYRIKAFTTLNISAAGTLDLEYDGDVARWRAQSQGHVQIFNVGSTLFVGSSTTTNGLTSNNGTVYSNMNAGAPTASAIEARSNGSVGGFISLVPLGTDNVHLAFDADYASSTWTAQDTSWASIAKQGDELKFLFGTGATDGSSIATTYAAALAAPTMRMGSNYVAVNGTLSATTFSPGNAGPTISNNTIATKSTSGPTATSCGTTPTVVGSRTMGHVALGAGTTTCELDFETAFTATPSCTVTFYDSDIRAAANVQVTTTYLAFGGFPAVDGGELVSWVCGDHF